MRRVTVCIGLLILLVAFVGCTSKQNNTEIEEAIRRSLATEDKPPDLVFENMEVNVDVDGQIIVLIWTKDKQIQREYLIHKIEQSFYVYNCVTSLLGEDNVYHFLSPASNTTYSGRFDFTDDPRERVMLIYIGEDDSTVNIREQFENEQLTDFTKDEIASFIECDLGGKSLVLVIPKYEGTSLKITVTGVSTGDAVTEEEITCSENGEPIYLWTDWNGYNSVEVMFNKSGFSIKENESVMELLKENNNIFIY